MTFNHSEAAAVARRYPHTVKAVGVTLCDLDSGADYTPPTLRHALGWINAGEWDSDGENPRSSRLARWWRNRWTPDWAPE